ncbi:hypothetical protein SteCoe_28532 [Stentor coeruleus]|uniref:Uncharacterized protein n=1 Tax=Stentor coeruleus TaxID=5963 RepID=A0A1R2B7Y8_9CILI|nr:hypothetical protein SteCoe_28532 [Stentor coeruleus]
MDFNELQEMLKKGQHKSLVTRLESQLSDVAKNEKFLSLLVQSYNEYGISLLETGQVDLALECLKKAEHFVDASTNLRAKTFNNLACCYKKIGKNSLAMRYLEKALFLYPSGDFHLNMCAVLSVEGKHIRALQEAMYAIIYIQEEIIDKVPNIHEFNEPKWEALAVSYHNMAVELEFLQKSEESITFYKKALNICEKYIESQKLQEKLEEDMQNALKFLSKTKKKKENPINIVYGKKKRVVIKSTQSKSPNPRSQTSPSKVMAFESRQENMPVGQIRSNLRKFVSSGVSKNKMFEFRKTVPYGKKVQEEELRNEKKIEEIGIATQRILRKISSDSEDDEDDSMELKVRIDEDYGRDEKGELVREKSLGDKALGGDDEEKKIGGRIEEENKDEEKEKDEKCSKDSYSEDWEGDKNKVKIEEEKRFSDENKISLGTGNEKEELKEKCEGSVEKSIENKRKSKESSNESEDYNERNNEHESRSKFTEKSNDHERKSSKFTEKSNDHERKISKSTEKSQDYSRKSNETSKLSSDPSKLSKNDNRESFETSEKVPELSEKSHNYHKESHDHSEENQSLSSNLSKSAKLSLNLPSPSQVSPPINLNSSSEIQNSPHQTSILTPNSETSPKINPLNPSSTSFKHSEKLSSDFNLYENSIKDSKSISSKPKTDSRKSIENLIQDHPSYYPNPQTDSGSKNSSLKSQSKISEASIPYPIREKSHTHSIVFDSITERPDNNEAHIAYMQTSRPSHSISKSSSDEEKPNQQNKEENVIRSISPKPSTGKSKSSGKNSRIPSGRKNLSPKKASKSPVPVIKTRNSAFVNKKKISKSPIRNAHSTQMTQVPDKNSRPSSKTSESRKSYKGPIGKIGKEKLKSGKVKEVKSNCEENKENDIVLKVKGENMSEVERGSGENSPIMLNNLEFDESAKEFRVVMKCVVDIVILDEEDNRAGEGVEGKNGKMLKGNSLEIMISEGGSEKDREKHDNTVIIHSNTQSANFLQLLDLGEKSEYSMLIKPFYELLLISNGEFPALSPISHNENPDFSIEKEKIQRFNTIESSDSQELYAKLMLPKNTRAKSSQIAEDKGENSDALQGKTVEDEKNQKSEEENGNKNKNLKAQSENFQKTDKNIKDPDEKYLSNMENMQIFHSLVEKTLENSRKAQSSKESSVAVIENPDLGLQNPNFYIEALLKTRGIHDNPDKNIEISEKNEENIGKSDQRPHRPMNHIEKAAFNSQSSFRSIKKSSTESKTEEKKIETPLCSQILNAPYPEMSSNNQNPYLSFKTMQDFIEKPENADKSNASDNFFNKKPAFSLSKNFSLQRKK